MGSQQYFEQFAKPLLKDVHVPIENLIVLPLMKKLELAELMKAAGCAGINFGADSADENILSALGRDHNRRTLEKMAALCHKNEIPFMADLLLGGPGETRETVGESIAFMKELDPLAVGISLGIRLYKNTPLGEKIRKEPAGWTECLQGDVEHNEDFLRPIYYFSPALGENITST